MNKAQFKSLLLQLVKISEAKSSKKLYFTSWGEVKSLSLFATPWTVANQAPPSIEFSRQEYWSGLPCPSPGDLPDPGIEPRVLHLLHWQAGSLPLAPPGKHKFHSIQP